jgi:hypothetical protein
MAVAEDCAEDRQAESGCGADARKAVAKVVKP